MKDKEIEVIEHELVKFLKNVNGVRNVFYDGMQQVIRFALGEKDCTISVDYQ